MPALGRQPLNYCGVWMDCWFVQLLNYLRFIDNVGPWIPDMVPYISNRIWEDW